MSRIGYSAGARVWGPGLWQASVTATKMLPGKQGDALASRQARAMRAVLLAARAWALFVHGPIPSTEDVEFPFGANLHRYCK